MTAPRPRVSCSSNPCLDARSIPWMRSFPPGSRRFRPEPGGARLHSAAPASELEGRHGHAISGPRHGQGHVEVDAVEGSDEALYHAVGLADHAALRVEDLDEQADVRGAGGARVVDIALEDGGALPTLARLPFHAELGFRLRRRVSLRRGPARAPHEHERHRRGHAETPRGHWPVAKVSQESTRTR